MIFVALAKGFQNHIGFATIRASGEEWQAPDRSQTAIYHTVTSDENGTITYFFAPVSACELGIARPRYHIHCKDAGRVSAGRFYEL